MSRVAIIGNSHVGAFRLAADRIEAAFPDVDLTFFALPRDRFYDATLGRDGVLRAKDAQDAMALNGTAELDLSGFDRILMAANPFFLRTLVPAMAQFDILDLAPAGNERSISLPLLAEGMRARVQFTVDRLERHLRRDPRVVVVQAPFPTPEIIDCEPDFAGMARQPDLSALIELFQTTVAMAMANGAFDFLPVPEQVLARPGFTKPRYARATTLAPGQVAGGNDYSHMNGDYGFGMFRLFADRFL